jgi:uncharacterized membrane protein YvbJ
MEQRVKCPICGKETPAGKRFCGHCGARLVFEPPPKKVCTSCGAENQPDQQFCSTCGARLVTPTAAPSTPSAVAASPAEGKQVTVKPTWGLAWGLWWRALIIALLFGAVVYLVAMLLTVTVFGWTWKLPFGS